MHDSLGSWGVDSEAWVTKHDKTEKQPMVCSGGFRGGGGGGGGPADMS